MTEAKFQFCWKQLYFNFTNLKTQSGKTVQVIYPGDWNSGPGPDFLNAEIIIDDILFRGSVELHLNPADWYKHKHEIDKHYDNSILHVCPKQLVSSSFNTLTSSNEIIDLLLIDIENQSIESLLKPCQIVPISENTIFHQAKLANTAYLIQSVNNLLNFSQTDLGLEKSFKRASIIRLFELLGSPFQKELFVSIGETVSSHLIHNTSIPIEQISTIVRNIGQGIGGKSKVMKGIKLAEAFFLQSLPISLIEFDHYYADLKKSIVNLFGKSIHTASLQRNWTVVLAYSWASLIYKVDAMTKFSQEWQTISISIPNSIEKLEIHSHLKNHTTAALNTNFPNFLLDQHKTYCSKIECLSCELKNNKTAS